MFIKFNWFPIFWTLFVVAAHGIPGTELPRPYWSLFEFDKIVHMLFFCMLVFAWMNGLFKQSASYKLKVHAPKLVLGFTITLGVLLETLQSTIFVGRSFQWSDIVADCTGVGIGFGLFYLIYGRVLSYTI